MEVECGEAVATDVVVRTQSRVRWYGLNLLALVALAGTTAIVLGQPLPDVVTLAFLSAAIGVTINRFALFPSELAVTAEPAVLIASIVVFRHDAPVLGPLVVALLAGPLDVSHWRQRAFGRMAYNAANRSLCVLAAALVFLALDAPTRVTTFGLISRGLAAAVVLVTLDLVITSGLLRLRGEPSWPAAVRHASRFEKWNLPFACVGVLAGLLVARVGWWVGGIVLLIAAFSPEVLAVRRRVELHRVWVGQLPWRGVVSVAALLGTATAIVLVGWVDAASATALLVVTAITGHELRVDARAAVPPVAAALVVGGLIVLGATSEQVVLSAMVALWTTLACWFAVPRMPFWAPLVACGAGALVAVVYVAAPSGAAAVLGALLFEVVVVLLGRRQFAIVIWTWPLLLFSVSIGWSWRASGPVGLIGFAIALGGAMLIAAGWGAPAWDSRIIGPLAARTRTSWHRAALVFCAACSLGLAGGAVVVIELHGTLVAASGAMGELAVMMVLAGVRQWRFEPRRRSREVGVLLVAGASIATVTWWSGSMHGFVGVLVIGIALAAVVGIGYPLGRLESQARSRPEVRRRPRVRSLP